MKDLRGKTALITGGASGIGSAVARRLAREGMKISLWDVNRDALDETVESLRSAGTQAWGDLVDVADPAKVSAAAERVRRIIGDVDVLDLNAGVVYGGGLLDLPDEKVTKTFAVNLLSHVWCLKAFLPAMIRKDDGHLVFMASAAGMLGIPGMAAYSASKHAVIGLAESVRLELKKSGVNGIGTTVVCPSFVSTGMFEGVRPPRLTPWLDPEPLADKIVYAVKKGRPYVREPFMVKLVPLVKAVPCQAFADWLGEALQMHGAMDTWTGRK